MSIGGFTNVKAEHDEDSGGEFALDTLNFFLIFDRFDRFRAVSELQLKDVFTIDEDHSGAHDFAFDVRRLFGDFTFSDELHLRAGTFLTPVGYWNLILAQPLTWTTEMPLIIDEPLFDETTTGVMLHGSTQAPKGRLKYSLFSQFFHPIEDDPELDPADLTAGARLEYSIFPGWAVGATYLASKNNVKSEDEEEENARSKQEWSHLGGLHFFWQHRRLEVLGEFMYRDGPALNSAQWGTYLQGVFEVYRPFYLVGRYEYFDPSSPEPQLNLFTIGAAYKPFPFMALKIEYRFADRSPEDDPAGFYSSFTTLF